MIVKLTPHGRGDVKEAIEYVLQETNCKGEKREETWVVYGNPDEVIAFSRTESFNKAVKKLKYFSGVIALAPGERLTEEQLDFLISSFDYVLNCAGQMDLPYVVVKHVENGREHYHFIGLNYDLITQRFYNPFRPGWEKKFGAWARLVEQKCGLRTPEVSRTELEREHYRLQLLASRTSNAELKERLDVKLKAYELEFLEQELGLQGGAGDEEPKRLLRRAHQRHTEYTFPKDPRALREIIDAEIERDRELFKRFVRNKAAVDNQFVVDRGGACANPRYTAVVVPQTLDVAELSAELERFKTEINLAEFIIANGGRKLKRSSANSYRIEWNGERFLVSRNDKGHWLFVGIDDPSKNGSIIDFCNVMGMENLGEIRKFLRNVLKTQGGVSQSSKDVEEAQAEAEVGTAFEDLEYVSREELFRSEILAERGLDARLLLEFFEGVKKDSRGMLCFPLWSEDEVVGYEVKGPKGLKRTLGSKQGLGLIGKNSMHNKRIVITESVFDCLAYEQLNRSACCSDTLYISTAGQVTQKQLELIRKLVAFKRAGSLKEVVLAFDNDEAGRAFAEKVKSVLQDFEDLTVREHYAQHGKDWNDELLYVMRTHGTKRTQVLR
ncbi:MAG: toprim domain-containing protein [Desulfurococcaceae archaeon]